MAKEPDIGEQPAKRAPGKKNTQRWCKGHVDREHVLVIQFSKWAYVPHACGEPKGWWLKYRPQDPWRCFHQEVCAVCGKIMEHWLPWQRCPDLPSSLKTAT